MRIYQLVAYTRGVTLQTLPPVVLVAIVVWRFILFCSHLNVATLTPQNNSLERNKKSFRISCGLQSLQHSGCIYVSQKGNTVLPAGRRTHRKMYPGRFVISKTGSAGSEFLS